MLSLAQLLEQSDFKYELQTWVDGSVGEALAPQAGGPKSP